jgi:hypothetical protein
MSEPLKDAAQNCVSIFTSYIGDVVTIIKQLSPDALANGFSTLVGALVGAMLAYFLQRKFQKTVEHEAAQISGHKLMFALLQQINTLVLIQRDYVHQHIGNPGRFLSIPATPLFDVKKNILELPDLSFLLNSKDARAILYNFYIAQENYIEAISQWNIRSSLHLEKVQPALAASTLENGSDVTEKELQAALGEYIYGSIINSTDNCLISLQRAFQKLSAVKVETRIYLVKRFKTKDFTDFTTPESYGLSEPVHS